MRDRRGVGSSRKEPERHAPGANTFSAMFILRRTSAQRIYRKLLLEKSLAASQGGKSKPGKEEKNVRLRPSSHKWKHSLCMHGEKERKWNVFAHAQMNLFGTKKKEAPKISDAIQQLRSASVRPFPLPPSFSLTAFFGVD